MAALLDAGRQCLSRMKKSKEQAQPRTGNARQDGTVSQLQHDENFRRNDDYTQVLLLQQNAANESQCTVSRSKATGKLIVIKCVRVERPRSANSERVGRRKQEPTEARILLSKLQPHPNIIRLFATERSPAKYRLHVLYFEYCTGGDLLDQLRKFQDWKKPTPEIFALHVFVSLACALAYIHSGLRHGGDSEYTHERHHEPLIHGDLKPDNIFLRLPGRQECGMPDVVLGDFGLSQLEAESWGISGTPRYDTPEVLAVSKLRESDPSAYEKARNARIMTTKSDMYQLGLIMHVVATRKYWKTGDDPQNLTLPERYTEITGFVAAVSWCLQPEQKNRPECTTDMEEGLLLAVEVLRKQRDAMFEKDGALDASWWNVSRLKDEQVVCTSRFR